MRLDTIERAAELLGAADRAVALTGAGVSTPSGIPDFRGDRGLWSGQDPAEVAALHGFQRDPRPFYRWFGPLFGQLAAARPNPAHTALARLEQAGRLHAVITQNIDGLHQRAGSREVYELHGHIRSATCVRCGGQVPSQPLQRTIARGLPPACPACRGALKPDLVLFGENLPQGLYWMARSALEQSDLVLVAGTSLEVEPAGGLPLLALRRGARLIIVNKSATHLDARADVVLRADVAEALPALAGRLLAEASAR
jgi:NAD-dependent deacetylase